MIPETSKPFLRPKYVIFSTLQLLDMTQKLISNFRLDPIGQELLWFVLIDLVLINLVNFEKGFNS